VVTVKLGENPIEYINNLDNNNIRNITIHEEIKEDKIEIIKKIKDKGYKVGISIKPNTNINSLIPYLDLIDIILIMSVEPGLGGQKYITNTTNKIENLKIMLKKNNINNIEIEVDGGINDTNIKLLKQEKIDISVVGSYITNSDNYQNQINNLKI